MLPAMVTFAVLGTSAAAVPARQPNASWATIPLFAHFRMANFTDDDLSAMKRTLRMVTSQGTLYGGESSEDQAHQMRGLLPDTPVLVYRNLYYAEAWDASIAEMKAHPEWQLKDASGKPINPEGKLVYNMTIPAVQEFYTACVANLSQEEYVDGAFGDSGCGVRPSWMSKGQQDAFAAGQINSAANAQVALKDREGLFVQNCPYVPHEPTKGSDGWAPGVDGIMYESWCSDFLTGVGGPDKALWCRDEVLAIRTGPASWSNGSVVQARYYLNGHNHMDPRFGAIAFLVAGYEGMYFGTSTDWNWHGDWEKQSLADSPFNSQPLGLSAGNSTLPQMLDSHGCGWSRKFASGAEVFLNFCYAPGHPMEAHATWADNSTWPKSLGAVAAREIREKHLANFEREVLSEKTSLDLAHAGFELREATSMDVCATIEGAGSVIGPNGRDACLVPAMRRQ